MTVLQLESFENSLSELGFSISQYLKKRVFTVKPAQEGEYFSHSYEILFFEILAPLHVSEYSWKYQTLFSKKSDMSQQP